MTCETGTTWVVRIESVGVLSTKTGKGGDGRSCVVLRAVGSVISGIYLDRVLLDCIGLQFVT
jgi:hypothetical protein